ncbi:MAG: methyltransferase type 11 [Opitutales bacterium]|jgi:hypothetical protein|nr:methyltransferase type 11 [Opitutales bacterium]MBT6962061.1 methyltransferase type 11 [Rhodospirillaceae bacterium]MDG2255992.1 hypothetical protein [Opitutaceae bacterium]
MTSFSIDWLDLREAADRRAREDKLLKQARHWLETDIAQGAARTAVDLGAGTGSTLRAFSMSSTQATDLESLSWRLVDQDMELLAEARLRHGGSHQLETYELDLNDLAALPLEGAHLITASALFDLVSADFIETLAAVLQSRCLQQPVGFYSALNYDGTTRWTPAHPLDEAVLIAFNHDQQRDKGFGLALGPDAGPYMERAFNSSDFRVFTANSPWVLDGTDSNLVNTLISGIGDAVGEDPALDAASLWDWFQFRKAHMLTGTCIVGHTDLLALPNVI